MHIKQRLTGAKTITIHEVQKLLCVDAAASDAGSLCMWCLASLLNIFLYARLQTGRIMVWWCPSVRPSGSPSVRPSVCPSVRPSQFSALFSYMLWHIDLKFCVSLYFYARKIKFECHQFPSLFAGVMLLFNFKLLQICGFPHFSPTCFDILSSNFIYDFVLMYYRASLSVVILLQFFLELCLFVNLEYSKYSFLHFSLTFFDILSWNFAYDFVLLYYRASSSVIILRQFLWELCPFCNLEYWKYTVFRTFLLHPLTYWAESLHITLFFCTTDQVWVSSICVYFRVMPLFELQFSALFSYMLWHIELKFCIWLCFTVLQIKLECHHFASIFVGVMPLLQL